MAYEHNFVTVCTNHARAYKDLKAELQRLRFLASELGTEVAILGNRFAELEAMGETSVEGTAGRAGETIR